MPKRKFVINRSGKEYIANCNVEAATNLGGK